MKKTLISLAAAFIVTICAALPAQAQLKFGPKIGMTVNSLHFNESVFDSDNRSGFTGGVMLQFIAPVVNLGFDASVMYVRRNLDATIEENGASDRIVSHRDYIEIPINLKYMIGLPAIGKIVSPFVTTGPSFAFLTSGTGINEAFKNKTFDVAWNFGFGLEIVQKVQVAASYGLGLSNSVVDRLSGGALNNIDIDGKTRCWAITAAYLF
ncbi:MAG: hypothetical protein C7K11_07640 [Candidatus Amulumruptor caecigallinarius]|uniref:PorT family protein n=1 Tax=Candidatus Amulumruptor caecigallinarius TaxID=2109911 RepID=A0A4Q0U7W0_9BACT|nr:MAG: hypothetical protein C7K11_07640 [Candidatus Amulumruptor caecigallinarius]HJE39225.1 PorT family protein [Candidatus Amulumruptor caecigallinarius]